MAPRGYPLVLNSVKASSGLEVLFFNSLSNLTETAKKHIDAKMQICEPPWIYLIHSCAN